MPVENESIKCLRCDSTMVMDQEAYIVPQTKFRGVPPGDETTVKLDGGRLVRLFLCSNPQCLSIEVKAANSWPTFQTVVR
jgi:hypothetical protein